MCSKVNKTMQKVNERKKHYNYDTAQRKRHSHLLYVDYHF